MVRELSPYPAIVGSNLKYISHQSTDSQECPLPLCACAHTRPAHKRRGTYPINTSQNIRLCNSKSLPIYTTPLLRTKRRSNTSHVGTVIMYIKFYLTHEYIITVTGLRIMYAGLSWRHSSTASRELQQCLGQQPFQE